VKTIAFIQARMGSKRLPGKVLAPLAGRPVLLRVVDRVRAADSVDAAVVLTSTDPRDEAVARLCAGSGVPFVRGSEEDVLDRYAQAAVTFGPELVVRVTADCPLIDPAVIDDLVALFARRPGLAYASVATGAIGPEHGYLRYPDGLDVEALAANVLAIAAAQAREPFEREHVTPYVRRHPELFSAAVLEADHDVGEERWTLDYPADLALLGAVYERLEGSSPEPFGYREVLALLEREPHLRELNRRHRVKHADPPGGPGNGRAVADRHRGPPARPDRASRPASDA
jgi:spore coat polysaccharide biosynthesis protein SpsF (cytidylyltransferase family)